MVGASEGHENAVMMGQLIQKIQDSIEIANEREKAAIAWRQSHDENSDKWRATIDLRLKPVEEWVSNANFSWKLFLGLVAVTAAVFKCWAWIKQRV